MFLIPVGLIFIFFYFHITLTDMQLLGFAANEVVVDILPDVVGYGLIGFNMWKMRDKSYAFTRALWLCAAMGILSVVLQLTRPMGLLGLLFIVVETAGILLLMKLLNMGIADMEQIEKRHLNLNVLERWRRMTQITYLAVLACTVGGEFLPLGIFGLLVTALWFFMALFYVITYFRTALRYKRMRDEKSGKAQMKRRNKNKKYLAAPLTPHQDEKRKK